MTLPITPESEKSPSSQDEESQSKSAINTTLNSHHGSDLDLDRSPSMEKKLLRKIDFHLMLPLWIVFVFSFLDRINLGNVSVLGIVPELGLKGNDFNIAMQIFFVPYILLELPSNIILKKFRPSTWISGLTFFWGAESLFFF